MAIAKDRLAAEIADLDFGVLFSATLVAAV